ncbi:DHA2 family efflux MFS transporter permease subunit [Melittangium boletus]|uniref:MFS transporter n=1 Tax=Melittangium boletus DSM 14713 TaxID=1294270 RepID=A0A250IM89_9BACT|nr:DHA2 family efflux MFS transporter permease subunit [Melittangium boletus]ATB32066.1 MFS transporter [Melittangium boletus DSM 14713]
MNRDSSKWLVTLSVTFGTLMGAIDSSIVNVAMPQLRSAVGATVQEITWTTTGFALATVMVMPLTAFLGRLFGQKRVYLACLGLFVVGSFLCGLAWNLPSLVLFRALQGFGAGALQPTEQAILRQTFPPKEQGMAMALFSMAVMVGPAIGPTLGGYIVDNFHWSWIFFINVPVGILGFFMVARFVREPEDVLIANRLEGEKQRENLDWQGILLLCVGLAALQYLLEEGQTNDWFESAEIVVCALVAGICLVAFVIRELTAVAPVVNLRLFKDPIFASGTVLSALMFSILMASMFLLPMFMQELLGFTATQSGLALMPRTLLMLAIMPIIGRVYTRFPPQLFISVGLAITGLGVYQMSHFNLDTGTHNIIAAILMQGLGFSMMLVPLSTVALSRIPRHRLPDATGLNSLLRQIGGSIGLAMFATLLSRYGTQATAALSVHLTPTRPEVMERLAQLRGGFMARGMDFTAAQETALRMLSGLTARQGLVLAFDKLFLLAALLFLLVLPLVLFLKAPPRSDGPHETPHIDVEI